MGGKASIMPRISATQAVLAEGEEILVVRAASSETDSEKEDLGGARWFEQDARPPTRSTSPGESGTPAILISLTLVPLRDPRSRTT